MFLLNPLNIPVKIARVLGWMYFVFSFFLIIAIILMLDESAVNGAGQCPLLLWLWVAHGAIYLYLGRGLDRQRTWAVLAAMALPAVDLVGFSYFAICGDFDDFCGRVGIFWLAPLVAFRILDISLMISSIWAWPRWRRLVERRRA